MITREDLNNISISIEDYGNGWYDSMLYYKGELLATYTCEGKVKIDEEGMQELEYEELLAREVPIILLNKEEREEAKKINRTSGKLATIKYINSLFKDEGLKAAVLYYELYIEDDDN